MLPVPLDLSASRRWKSIISYAFIYEAYTLVKKNLTIPFGWSIVAESWGGKAEPRRLVTDC